jgi:5-amino-6-(5-phosphoribosylamino)uracil reductase
MAAATATTTTTTPARAPGDRPRVLINFASSLDGKIAPAAGRRPAVFAMSRGPEDRRRMRSLRERADAVLIGASNLRADDPGLSVSPEELARRRAAGQPLPARIVITSRGDGVPEGARMFDPARGGPSYVAHAAMMPPEARARLGAVAHLVELGDDAVAVDRLLRWLRDDLRAGTVLCEGGGVLVAQLFAARAVDEMYLTLVPRILGGGPNAPTLAAGDGFAPDEIPDGALTSVERIGDELFLRYDFRWG